MPTASKAKTGPRKGRWGPGQSGNPTGRRPIPEDVKALFRAATVPVAQALIDTALDRSHDQHVKAAIHVLERSLGKVAQPVVGENGGPLTLKVLSQLDDTELVKQASEMLRARAEEQPEEELGELPAPQQPPMTGSSTAEHRTLTPEAAGSNPAPSTCPSWFAQLLRTYPRIAIAGGPRTGKTTLSVCAPAVVPGIRIEHTDDLIGCYPWEAVPAEIEHRLNGVGAFVLEGVQVGRCLRKGLEVDAIVWLDVPHVKLTDEQESMRKGCVSIFTEWRRDALLSGAWDQTDLPSTHGATIYTRRAAL